MSRPPRNFDVWTLGVFIKVADLCQHKTAMRETIPDDVPKWLMKII